MLAPHIDAVWVVRPDAVAQLPSGIDYVTPDTPRYHRVTSRATYFVNNVDWTLGLVKRPGQIHVHTHEGTPLGHMGVDLLSRPAAKYRADVRAQLRRADRWDFSLVSSPYAQQIWDRAYPCHFTSLPTGAPRNDVLVRGDHMRKAALRKRLGVPDGNTVVLYAPTRRDHRKSYVPRLDFEQLLRGLGPTVTLLVRLHPKDAQAPFRGLQLRDLQRRGLLLDVTDEPSAVDMMLVSDALVTDYSSLLFDYANTDRPIIVHGDDWEAYRAARGVYFDVLADPPGHVTTTTDELTDLFASGAWQDARSAALRADFHAAVLPLRRRARGRPGGLSGHARPGAPPVGHSPAGHTTAPTVRTLRSSGRHTLTCALRHHLPTAASVRTPRRSPPCQTPFTVPGHGPRPRGTGAVDARSMRRCGCRSSSSFPARPVTCSGGWPSTRE